MIIKLSNSKRCRLFLNFRNEYHFDMQLADGQTVNLSPQAGHFQRIRKLPRLCIRAKEQPILGAMYSGLEVNLFSDIWGNLDVRKIFESSE